MRPAINITSRCNNECQMCPFRQGRTTDEKDITWEKFTEIMGSLPENTEAVMLFNKGEPFLHPRIYDMVEYSKFPVILSTNAVCVKPDKLNYDKISVLCVSIPAGNRETYKQITKRDNFDLVIKIALELQNRARNDFYVKIVEQPENKCQEALLNKIFKRVVVVEDSNKRGFMKTCSQPDITPVYTASGRKLVCCRDAEEKYDYDKYYEQAKRRELPICEFCGIS